MESTKGRWRLVLLPGDVSLTTNSGPTGVPVVLTCLPLMPASPPSAQTAVESALLRQCVGAGLRLASGGGRVFHPDLTHSNGPQVVGIW